MDAIDKIFDSSESSEEGEFKILNVKWKASSDYTSIIHYKKFSRTFIKILIRLARLIYQMRQFKKAFPDKGSIAFKLAEFRLTIIRRFTKKEGENGDSM